MPRVPTAERSPLFNEAAGETEWMNQAACRGSTATFFPERGRSIHEPLSVCHTCPMQAQCLDYALRHHIDHGIWGGCSMRDRRKLKKIYKDYQGDLRDVVVAFLR